MNEKKLDPERQKTLDAERAFNEQYIEAIKRKLDEYPNLIKQVAITQSQQWTESSLPHPEIGRTATTAIIGRVALNENHPYSDDLGQTVYIAGWHIKNGDFETVNWAAPVASLFFQGRSSAYPIAPSVEGRRTFIQRRNDLVDYSDEIESDVSVDPFKSKARHLEIPAAPTLRRPVAGLAGETRKPTEPKPVDRAETPTNESGGELEAAESTEGKGRIAGIRAADAVATVIQEPKRGHMGTILPTMQPDQYRLVSSSSNRGLIVQGQPGTGKTVIALHRAVYLTSSERDSNRISRLAIVGPTDGYGEHVRPILSELKEPDADIEVISLPARLRQISGLASLSKPGPIGRIESSWELGREIDRFVRAMSEPPKSGRIDQRVRHLVESLKNAHESEVADSEIHGWLADLPNWDEIISQIRYVPMLAAAALALAPHHAGQRYGHLIVDEAQDIRGLEWRILVNSLLEPGGSLSLLGDMNQRRSDFTYSSWHDVAENLEMTDDKGEFTVQALENGFRSTKQILKFANQLLPREARDNHALLDGPKPKVAKVSRDSRKAAAVDSAIELTTRHSGTVAIIANVPGPVRMAFRRRGWNRGKGQHTWTMGEAIVVVAHPDEARGLEFDAVVVVEPGSFPKNVGRHGLLYTSLTRANKELVVVHSKPLPRNLSTPSSLVRR